ncbi:ATP-binding protein [Pedobacter sp. MW01-1-1]
MPSNRPNFNGLNGCILKLYKAENSCRMYLVSRQPRFYTLFVADIKSVGETLDSIFRSDTAKQIESSNNFNILLAQKKERTERLLNLKKLSDSLMGFSSIVKEKVAENNDFSKVKEYTTSRFISVVRVDTLNYKAKPLPKKKFFGRLISAFKKTDTVESDSLAKANKTLVKKTISADTSKESKAYNKVELSRINDYYRRIYKLNMALKNSEIDLLAVNHKLIEAIAKEVDSYKNCEWQNFASLHDEAIKEQNQILNNQNRFTFILFAFVTGLLVVIFYFIYRFYKKEEDLIRFSSKAELLAISKSRLLATMSHEIRTPLNSIVGFSEQLNQLQLSPVKRQHISAIRNSSLMLLEVVNDILDFSKYETGKVTLEQAPFSVHEAISDVFQTLSILAEKKNIAYDIKLGLEKTQYVLGDSLRLRQVIMNLLGNAIKFTEVGKVSLEANFTKLSNDSILLEVAVSDTGVGINEVDQKLIFDEFAQANYSSAETKAKGTGLGLAICKRIIELHKGKIKLLSKLGEGTVFSFHIPYKIVDKPIKDAASVLLKNEAALAGKKVLLVDDNTLNILLAGTILKRYKIQYDSATNGVEALDLIAENKYDIILTDIQMPIMDGIELALKIRSLDNPEKRYIPILGVTANVMQEDRDKYLTSGMSDLVLKPFFERELIEKIITYIK